LFAFGKKLERRRIQTITLAGWRRTVREDMSLMAVASSAADLDADHSIAGVAKRAKMFRIERGIKRRPAGTGIELVF
jgi:hypothetical protein